MWQTVYSNNCCKICYFIEALSYMIIYCSSFCPGRGNPPPPPPPPPPLIEFFGNLSFLLLRVTDKGCPTLLSPMRQIVICENGLCKSNLIEWFIERLYGCVLELGANSKTRRQSSVFKNKWSLLSSRVQYTGSQNQQEKVPETGGKKEVKQSRQTWSKKHERRQDLVRSLEHCVQYQTTGTGQGEAQRHTQGRQGQLNTGGTHEDWCRQSQGRETGQRQEVKMANTQGAETTK